MQNQDFYTQNQQFFNQNPWPTTEELIGYANKHLEIGKNEDESHKISLYFLIDSFRSFLEKHKTKSCQSFWIFEEPQDGLFPFKKLQATMKSLLKSKILWVGKSVDQNYKHEHFVVLFFLAAMRYVKFPLPVRQHKYKNSKGQLQLADLFLFHKNSENCAAFALQINLLTSSDLFHDGKLNCESLRSADYIGKYLDTKEALEEKNIRFAASTLAAMGKSETPKTLFLMVHVNPDQVKWKGIGLYDETVRSEVLAFEYKPPNKQSSLIAMFDDDGDDDNNNNAKEKIDHSMSLEESQSSLSTQSQNQASLRSPGTSHIKPKDKNERIKENYQSIPFGSQSTNPSSSQALSINKESSQSCSTLSQIVENIPDSSINVHNLIYHEKENLPLEATINEEIEKLLGDGIKRRNDFKELKCNS